MEETENVNEVVEEAMVYKNVDVVVEEVTQNHFWRKTRSKFENNARNYVITCSALRNTAYEPLVF